MKHFRTIILLGVFFAFLNGDYLFASNFKLSPPAINEDGSPITFTEDLGYVFHCDNDSGYPYSIRVDVGHIAPDQSGIVRVPLNSVLPEGIGLTKWYCAATSYYLFNADKESEYSNEIFFVASDGTDILSVIPSAPGLSFER